MAHHDLIVSEFLESLSERADRNYQGRIHQAFLDWYIEAEFGRHAKWDFTDDVKDGGVDAVVWCPNEIPPVFVIQSKFSAKVGRGQLGKKAYSDFCQVVEAFRHGGDLFDRFIDTVRDDLRHRYRRAVDQLAEAGNWASQKKAFRLVTTATRRQPAEFDQIPRENFVYAPNVMRIYSRYRKGQTPTPKPLLLNINDKMEYPDRERGVRSYLFNARMSDFQEYFRSSDVARLVARNIRYNLAGKVGRAIRETYEKHPKDFWYFHNGLTIVCDKFSEENGIATLQNPSVINGAQTLYAIGASKRMRSPALVAVRAIVRGTDGAPEDDSWLQKVIRGVNTQNRVLKFDFSSNEPEQVELQHLFQEFKVFYERKRGEWKEVRNDPRFHGFSRLSLKDLGLILTAVSDDTGGGVLLIKQGMERVFDEKHYRVLFPSKSRVAHRFKKIYLAYRLSRFLIDYGYPDAKTRRRQGHARWNTLWLLSRGFFATSGVTARCSLESIRNAFDAFESYGSMGKHARAVIHKLVKAVWKAWRKARKTDPERWTANNFFKSPFGNQQLLKLAYPETKQDLRSLGKELLS